MKFFENALCIIGGGVLFLFLAYGILTFGKNANVQAFFSDVINNTLGNNQKSSDRDGSNSDQYREKVDGKIHDPSLERMGQQNCKATIFPDVGEPYVVHC